MICEKCKPCELEAMRALESLTPSGSEFVNDVKRRVEFVRSHDNSQMSCLIAFKKEANALRKALEEIITLSQVALNGTDRMNYEVNRADITAVAQKAIATKHVIQTT